MSYIHNILSTMLRATAALAAILAAHPAFLLQTQAQIIIDDFGEPASSPFQQLIVGIGAGEAELTYTGSAGHILGATRTIAISEMVGSGYKEASAIVRGPSYPSFTFNNDFGLNSLCLLQYDGGTDGVLDPEGLGGIFLGSISSGRFRFEFSKDNPSVSLTLRLYTDADHASAAVVSWGAGAVVEPVEVELAFAAFAPIGSAGGVDFGRVGVIELLITGDAGLDFGLDNLVVVPEPSWSMGLAAFGMLAWAGGRRARRGPWGGGIG